MTQDVGEEQNVSWRAMWQPGPASGRKFQQEELDFTGFLVVLLDLLLLRPILQTEDLFDRNLESLLTVRRPRLFGLSQSTRHAVKLIVYGYVSDISSPNCFQENPIM